MRRWGRRQSGDPEELVASSDLSHDGGIFSVRTEADGDALVVRACGELDMASAEGLERELRKAFEDGASTVLLDLGNVEFIDATGLSVLLAVAKLTTANQRQLRIVRRSPPVQRAVEATGLDGERVSIIAHDATGGSRAANGVLLLPFPGYLRHRLYRRGGEGTGADGWVQQPYTRDIPSL